MAASGDDEPRGSSLPGGRFANPVLLRGAAGHPDIVERTTAAGRRNVHALLRHLRSRGVTMVPEVLGWDPTTGREQLGHLAGSCGVPPLTEAMRSAEALVSAVLAVRAVHDASVGFEPPDDGWHHQEVAVAAETDCYGHLDLAPWNLVFDDARVVGIIDWDTAGPTTRVWDLCYLAYQLAPLHPDGDLAAYGWVTPPDRRGRLSLVAQTYGGVTVEDLLDVLPVRLAATAAVLDRGVRAADPAYAALAGHAQGWRDAARRVIQTRADLLG